jgi:hypothetical protein
MTPVSIVGGLDQREGGEGVGWRDRLRDIYRERERERDEED